MRESDRPLLRACMAGDRQAWEALIRRYQRLLYAIPLRCGLSEEDAADVLQTVCVRLLENLPKLCNEDHLTGWLITTTRRESWRVSQQRRRDAPLDDPERPGGADSVPDPDPLPDEAVLRLEEQQMVRVALRELGGRCQQLLELLYQTDPPLSYVEVAQRLAMPATSVSSTRIRCLQKLKRILDGMGF
jgi:RNA polymerase sigma factor (sigma-70 family)